MSLEAVQIDSENYHADTSRVSKSGLDLIDRSPRHYWAKYLDPNRKPEEETPALRMGKAIHYAILEPDEFKSRYFVAPQINRRTNAGKAEWAELQAEAIAQRKVLLDAEDMATCLAVRDAVWTHPTAKELLRFGLAEQTILFEEPNTGAPCKMRPDWLATHHGLMVDVKSTEDASPFEFAKSVVNYRYDVQASFYPDGMFYATGERPKGFVFIAAEKVPPYNVGLYYATPEVMQRGRRQYLKNLTTYMECRQSNQWPGYSLEIEPLALPGWAK